MGTIGTYLRNLFNLKKEEFTSELNGIEKADIMLQELIDLKKIPGLAITIIKDGETIFQKGYGWANLEEKISVDPKTSIFRIASVSKNMAATALAYMVQDGLIDLDASLYNYVPYFPKKKYDFTIRQLASHTAGIRSYQGKEYGLNLPYSIKDGLDIFKDDALLFEPGTDYHYNSFDWVLISVAMQEASGIPFEEYVQQKVLQPLGLKNTFAPNILDPKVLANVSNFYSKTRIGFRPAMQVDNFYKLAGGGYLSTSSEIAKFGQGFLGGNVIDNEMVSQFLAAQIVNGASTFYGLGWQVSEDKKGRPFFGHIGNSVGAYSNLFIYPEEEMVFSILTNCTNPKIQDEWDEVVDFFIIESREDMV